MPSSQPAATLARLSSRSLHPPPRRFQCERQPPQPTPSRSRRPLTTTAYRAYDASATSSLSEAQPRWAHTPERMTAPVSLKRHDPANEYPVNESAERLDAFYERFLGDGGHELLTEEVKWLAVTHKSFDQGRRGYNDRLAFLGMRPPPFLGSMAGATVDVRVANEMWQQGSASWIYKRRSACSTAKTAPSSTRPTRTGTSASPFGIRSLTYCRG